MRTLKLGLGVLVLGVGPLTWSACSAEAPVDSTPEDAGDESAIVDEDTGVEVVDTGIDTGKDSGKDSGKDTGIDTGTVIDTGIDTGSPDPVPGTPCPTLGAIYTKVCGACGKQDSVCDTGKVWSAYGPCTGEVVGGCVAGSTRTAACGKCGTQSQICTSTCAWVGGACTGEGPCTAGEKRYITAGCVTVDTFRAQVCDATCNFGAPAPLPCTSFPADLTISPTVGNTVFFDTALSPITDVIPKLNSGTCPATLSATLTTYKYVVIKNATALTATVDIFGGRVLAADPDIDTIMAVYKVPPPSTATERAACIGYIDDSCAAPCTSQWAGLVGTQAPTIPPGGSLVVYTAAYFNGPTYTGKFRLNVTTKSLL